MVIHPKKGFIKIVALLESINPFLVILSIIGLFCEYTDLKQYVLFPNQIISILFVVDFLIRFIAHNPKKYFLGAYGWVDFLASLPGFMFFLGNTPLLTVFKVIKIGRFFRIIRILRFLRVFKFLKKMKSDSTWVQDRIMQIGVTIVLVFVVGIIVVDSRVQSSLQNQELRVVQREYRALNSNLESLVESREDIQFYSWDSVLYTRDGQEVKDYSVIHDLLDDDIVSYLFIQVEEGVYSPDTTLLLPTHGVILPLGIVQDYQNSIMLALLTTLLVILTVMIFYMGFIFAKDMQIIQLVVDSFDAGDDLLLKQEAQKYMDENSELVIDPDESELISLLKVAANISSEESIPGSDSLYLGLPGLSSQPDDDSNELQDICDRIESLEFKYEENSSRIIKETVKKITPAIVRLVKKNLDN